MSGACQSLYNIRNFFSYNHSQILVSVSFDQSRVALFGSLWSSRITIDIVFHQHWNLKPQNFAYVILSGQLLLCVLCHGNRTANRDDSCKVGSLA